MSKKLSEIDDKIKRFEKRMEIAREQQEKDEEAQAERLRIEYLQRTGRTQLKP